MDDDIPVHPKRDAQIAKFAAFLEELYPRLPALSKAIPTKMQNSGLDLAKLCGQGDPHYGWNSKFEFPSRTAASAELEIAWNLFMQREEGGSHRIAADNCADELRSGYHPRLGPDYRVGPPKPGAYEREGIANGLAQAMLKVEETYAVTNEVLDRHLGPEKSGR